MTTVYDFTAQRLNGGNAPLSEYRGQVLLVVNTASRCGFTSQYAGLEALHRALSPRGFAVLGFPCNQFGAQEPGDAAEIATFCDTKFQVSFPLFAKVEVNGTGAHPLFAFLRKARPGVLGTEAIKWNFTKFLIDRQGQPVARYAPKTAPAALQSEVERVL